MNCADVRARLTAFAYGDLSETEASQVRQHLGRCLACEQERRAITEVQRLLDAVPAPTVAVDLPRLYRDVADGHGRQVRRWRFVALAGLAAAVVVAALLVSHLEVRVDANQLVLRWGAGPTAPDRPELPPPAPPRPQETTTAAPLISTAEINQQLRMLRELVQAISDDADLREQRRQREIAALQNRMRGLEQQMTQLRLAAQREVTALYTAQVAEKPGGTQR